MTDPIQALRDIIESEKNFAKDEFTEAADAALTQVENLVRAAQQIDYHGIGLISREYRPNSPTVYEMISDLRDALAPFKDTP